MEDLILVLSAYAPHICEELWQRLGHAQSLAYQPWPTYDPKLTQTDSVTMSIQVNGKHRATLTVDSDTPKDSALNQAKELEPIAKQISEKQIVKEIFVPKKIINFVVK